MTHEQMADLAWEQLLGWARGGLPTAYSGIYDAMADWWVDLPWDVSGQRAAVVHLLTKPQADVAEIDSAFPALNVQAMLAEALAN